MYEISTDIPFGNACDINSPDGIPVVSFSADPHGGPECLWFCFRLRRKGRAQSVPDELILRLAHTDNMLGCSAPANIRPVARVKGDDWVRLHAGTPRLLPDGRRCVDWIVKPPKTYMDVAFCYPYGRQELETLQRDTGRFWRVVCIGVSQGGRPLMRWSSDYGEQGGMRPGLYLIARQHSGETPGSWMLDGFLRSIAALGKDSPLVWVVPFANVDGVEQGDYGKDNFPHDLNRAWGNPPMRHETLVLQRDMQRWKKRCRPVLGLDFHAPGGTESDGIYAYLPNPDLFPERHKEAAAWAGLIAAALGPAYAAKSFARVARYASRWESPTAVAYWSRSLGMCGLCTETPYAMCGQSVLTRENYQEAGARMASAITERIAADQGAQHT